MIATPSCVSLNRVPVMRVAQGCYGCLQMSASPLVPPKGIQYAGLRGGFVQRSALSARSSPRSLVYTRSLVVKAKKEASIYKDTVNLPQTKFDMRANAKVKEPALQKWWAENRIYESLYENAPHEEFTLHDGPPYANGDLHIGHALNKILKDFINKYHILQGRKVRYVPGWDCHGLPIELKVLQSMKQAERQELTPIKLRKKAAKFAMKAVESQREQFKRYGVWGDWEDPYVTLAPAYEAAQIDVFGKMLLNGHIYRGKKPVHWSPSSQTALAEAELEYPPGHKSRSIYVNMPIVEGSDALPDAVKAVLPTLGLAIWTTTPWTMPANAAVAVNADLTYVAVELTPAPAEEEGAEAAPAAEPRHLVVGKDLVASLAAKWGAQLTVIAEMKGSALEGCQYRHPLFDRVSPVVIGGDYITTESGTGLVHTAPGHGQDDYIVGLKYGLPLYSPVDDRGDFTAEAGAFEGLSVLGEGNAAVIEALQESGRLLLEEEYGHKYPYDWRTKKPTIFRATEQWFASVEGFRAAALGVIEEVQWIPASGENRIRGMTQGRSDWCISRQRNWGVPIPVFYHKETREPLMTEATIQHIRQVVAERGTDAWFYLDTAELLPEDLRHLADDYERGTDTMDVWFDSGSSWAAVVEGREGLRYPADLYLEGSDQHRGWFQSSLLTSVASRGSTPYKTVLTHGFVLDEKGFKMSKSLGNVVDPRLVIDGGKDQKADPPYGADVLRLWVSSVDYTSDVLIGGRILKQMFEVYRKLRGSMRYLLGNLYDYTPDEHQVAFAELPEVDRYALTKLAGLLDGCTEAFEQFQFYRVFQLVNAFNTSFLSNFYLDMAKDRLYIRAEDDPARRACQQVLATLATSLASVLAPITPHMAEDAYRSLPFPTPHESVFQAGWAAPRAEWRMTPEETAQWEALLQVRSAVNGVLETARAAKLVGAATDAKVAVWAEDAALHRKLKAMESSGAGVDELRYLLIVSDVAVLDSSSEVVGACGDYNSITEVEGLGKVAVGVAKADGEKCERCWNYSSHVGANAEHPTLCERCVPVITAKVPAAAVGTA